MADQREERAAPQSHARRDHLRGIEKKVQAQWAANHAHDQEPDLDSTGPKEKYFCTFPYPYMNGVLHLGHAFTLSKVEFAARYQRLKGKRVLFPFGLHCTGMPIAACADRLKREIEQYGNPPKFPPPEEEKEEPEAEGDAEEDSEKAEAPKKGKAAPKKEEKKKVKKAKLAKKTGNAKWQWDIMREMGVDEKEIANFQDARYWLKYFPPIALDDLTEFGLYSDFRRSFITTDVNPYYDSFVRWQFNTLRKRDKIAFGARNTIFSPLDDQPCADHDRASGEGVMPQEYTLIKLELLDMPEELKKIVPAGKKVILPAATLRPETMYGQTNVYLLPEGVYGVYQTHLEDEVFVCSERSALNMSYQGMSPVRGKPSKLGEIQGAKLMGCPVKAPLTKYERVYVLPLLTIKMDKGTGVVTSVPSDAPDDYAALMDLINKKPLRDKYGITEDMVVPFAPLPIIDIPGLGTLSAVDLCKEKKVTSQNQRDLLDQIKERVYLEGFYKGVMIVGEFAGTKVIDAKPKVRELLIAKGLAASYAEPEAKVMSRSGCECVVALTDQWYLKYGHADWKASVEKHVRESLETYSEPSKKRFLEVVDWLHEWACSRSYGLGTKLPWDTQFVIESLSDSTIYMAYYTVCHLLQGGTLDGSKPGPLGIKADELTDAVWDYIFLRAPYPKDTSIPEATLERLRSEFQYWYPMDMRGSGKDLIGNHLTMSLYNHAAVWENQPEMMPQSFYCNGHLMINAEKMSKSTGNFLTLKQCVDEYSADATRIALADGGDGLEDANFAPDAANKVILRLTKEEKWLEEVLLDSKEVEKQRTGPFNFFDQVFANEINVCLAEADKAYNDMQFRSAVKASFYDLTNVRDQYRASVPTMHRDLVQRWAEAFTIALCPIAPHFCQWIWQTVLKRPGEVGTQRWPAMHPEDYALTRQMRYLRDVGASFRLALQKAEELAAKKSGDAPKKGAKPAKGEQPKAGGKKDKKDKKDKEDKKEKVEWVDSAYVFVASTFPEWQRDALGALAKLYAAAEGSRFQDKSVDTKAVAEAVNTILKGDKSKVKTAMQWVATVQQAVRERGEEALELRMPFDEEKLLNEYLEFVMRDIPVKKTEIVPVHDGKTAVDIPFAHNAKAIAQPGRPQVFYFHSANPPEATPAPSAGGAGPKGGNKPKAGGPAPKAGGKGKKEEKGKAPAKAAPAAAGAAPAAAAPIIVPFKWKQSWEVAASPAPLAYFSPRE